MVLQTLRYVKNIPDLGHESICNKKEKKYNVQFPLNSSRHCEGLFILKVIINFYHSLNIPEYQWVYFNWLPFISHKKSNFSYLL